MSSKAKDTGHVSSNEFGARDILKKFFWDILKTCPSYVLTPKCVLKFSKEK